MSDEPNFPTSIAPIKRGPGRPPKPPEVNQMARTAQASAESMPSATIEGRKREARNVFGQQRQKMSYEARQGYHRHWFNDVNNRIGDAKSAGYEHVLDKEGKPVKRTVGTAEGGGPLIALLMEIPQEWYDEDMAEQQQARELVMNQIRRTTGPEVLADDKRYVPTRNSSGMAIEPRRG